MYLLDTDHCIYTIKSDSRILHKLQTLPENAEIYTSIIAAAELFYGAYSSKNKEKRLQEIQGFLSQIAILPVDSRAAQIYGEIKADLRSKGLLIEDNDLFIASIAKSHALKLVTHNIRHFNRVSGLEIEDWLE